VDKAFTYCFGGKGLRVRLAVLEMTQRIVTVKEITGRAGRLGREHQGVRQAKSVRHVEGQLGFARSRLPGQQ
jgi:hypothetical protein